MMGGHIDGSIGSALNPRKMTAELDEIFEMLNLIRTRRAPESANAAAPKVKHLVAFFM
jgi:hypothetical protein